MNKYAEIKEHLSKTIVLAYPVVIGQAGHMMTHIADSMMVGRTGSTPLAAASLAGGAFTITFVMAIGISMGVTPLVGKANGEGNQSKVSSYLKNSLIVNFLFGIVLSLIPLLTIFIFHRLGQSPQVVELTIPYFKILLLGLVPYMVFMTLKQFLDGLEATKPGMVISIVFNVLNIILCYIFIYGKCGIPAMGLNGAGWATFIARSGMSLSLFLYVLMNPKYSGYIKGWSGDVLSIKRMWELVRIGFPVGIQFVLEVGAFTAGAVIIGWYGPIPLAAHNIALTSASLTYLMSSGISAAATIRISNFVGKRDFRSMKMSGYTAYLMVIIFMGICGLVFVILRNYIPTLFNYETEVVRTASVFLVIAGLFQLFDGIQVVSLGALRGMTDVKVPTIIALFSYWIVTLPVCYLLAKSGLHETGVWFGFMIGLMVAAVLLFLRFRFNIKKYISGAHQYFFQ
jgi:MATE family multidrug resistance protein